MWRKVIGIFAIIVLQVQSTPINPPKCDPSWSRDGQFYNDQVYGKYKRSAVGKTEIEDIETLKQIHVLFRHGERSADEDALYPLDPYIHYKFYPIGYGQLTNNGKIQEYNIGVTLRNRYNDFLGDIYYPEILYAQSTDYNRTKASLELALAGLWPPKNEQIWHPALLWQPIPYNYVQDDKDTLLGDPIITCPYYNEIYTKNLLSADNTDYNNKLKNFYAYLSYHTGLNITKVQDVYNIYFTIRVEEEWGLKLPEWLKCVWPQKFLEVTIKQYEQFTQNEELTSFSSGIFLEKIIKYSENLMMNRTISVGRKLFLYSTHERNVALTLIGLNLYYPYEHIPPYGSYIIIELHQIDGVYGYKIFYEDYTGDGPKLLTIPNCNTFCPLNQFYKLVKNRLPKRSCY